VCTAERRFVQRQIKHSALLNDLIILSTTLSRKKLQAAPRMITWAVIRNTKHPLNLHLASVPLRFGDESSLS